MDFALTDEQVAIFDMAHAFGQEHVAPFARAWESAGEIPRDLWPRLAELGFGGLYVSEDHGGSGLGRLDATLVFEALSMACPSVASFLSIHNMCAAMLDKFGSDAVKSRFLEPATRMETVLSYCLTEPGSGSDAAALATRADKGHAGYRLNGTKAFISGGGYSDAYVVMCRTGGAGPKGISTLVVEAGAEGLSFGGLEDKMGWRSQPTRQVQFDDCLVPLGNLVGQEGDGFRYAMIGLDGGRLNISACSLGGAQAALNGDAGLYGRAQGVRPDDRPVSGAAIPAGRSGDRVAGRARLFAPGGVEAGSQDARRHQILRDGQDLCHRGCSRIADQCLQLHGGYGYLADYGIEKIVRDLRVHQILEGTNEIMRLITARALLAERG